VHSSNRFSYFKKSKFLAKSWIKAKKVLSSLLEGICNKKCLGRNVKTTVGLWKKRWAFLCFFVPNLEAIPTGSPVGTQMSNLHFPPFPIG
jgi:hypothetical protein